MQELINNLKNAIAEAKNAISDFEKQRKNFDKDIEYYNNLREKKFDKDKKTQYVEFKEDIEKLEKEILELKAENEDINNIKKLNLNDNSINILKSIFSSDNIKSKVASLNLLNKKGRFTHILKDVNTYEKIKKRLEPLYNILRKHRFNYKNLNDNSGEIEKRANKILKLNQQKDKLKKKMNPYPSASFGYKIAHIVKIDPDKYLNKIYEMEKNFKFVPYPAYPDREWFIYFESHLNRFKKIKDRFDRITKFMNDYSKELKAIENTNDVVDSSKLKKLEQKEMIASQEDKQDLAEKLGIKERNTSSSGNSRNKLQKDVVNIAKDGSGQIRISDLTTPNSSLDKGLYWLKTPFEKVRIQVDKDGDIYVYPKSKNVAPTYNSIALKLDMLFTDGEKKLDKNKIVKGVIEPIIGYLKQRIPITRDENLDKEDFKNQKLLDKIKKDTSPRANFAILDKEQIEAAAVLCGILMLAESHQFRNPTLGKFERSSVKRVKQLALRGCTNPFSIVYLNSSGEYINAHDSNSDTTDKHKALKMGGIAQTKEILEFKVIGEDIAVNKNTLPSFILAKIKNNMFIDSDGKRTSSGEYIKIVDLDAREKYKFFKEDKKQTIREFIEKRLDRNMRNQYKMLNRTPNKRNK